MTPRVVLWCSHRRVPAHRIYKHRHTYPQTDVNTHRDIHTPHTDTAHTPPMHAHSHTHYAHRESRYESDGSKSQQDNSTPTFATLWITSLLSSCIKHRKRRFPVPRHRFLHGSESCNLPSTFPVFLRFLPCQQTCNYLLKQIIKIRRTN